MFKKPQPVGARHFRASERNHRVGPDLRLRGDRFEHGRVRHAGAVEGDALRPAADRQRENRSARSRCRWNGTPTTRVFRRT